MKSIGTIIFIMICLTPGAQTVPSAIQIKTALLAAPEDKRSGAMVYGYDTKGDLVVLRKGNNEMVCIADNPKQEGISVSCYHIDLEPFMARGRELKAAGKSFQRRTA